MIEGRVTGIPDLRNELRGVVPKLRVRALRNALAAGARVVQRAARADTPVIAAGAPAVRAGHRKPGTVRRAISVRTSKEARRAGDVGVFVNVRPLKRRAIAKFKAAAAGKGGRVGGQYNPDDPYYWMWLQFGRKARGASGGKERVARIRVTRNGQRVILRQGVRASGAKRAVSPMRSYGMLRTGAAQLPLALQEFIRSVGPQIEKLNRPKAPAP